MEDYIKNIDMITANGIHNGLNTHHQFQSILSNIFAKKNKINITVRLDAGKQLIVNFLSVFMFPKFISPIY